MMKILCLFAFVALIAADNFPISNTGAGLPAGASDPNWSISSGGPASPAIVVGVYANGWYSPPSDYRWISWSENQANSVVGGVGVGNFYYTTTFDLTNYDPSTASISGNVIVDDSVSQVILNGNIVLENFGDLFFPSSFSINSGFISGLNTLTFVVYNQGGPTGLGLEISGTAQILTADYICQNANQADWAYGQGYYCINSANFVQCWGDPVQSAEQPCQAGTTCVCSSQLEECSDFGQVSPCQ